jgi:AraC family transcriptional regulator, activator of mtrCDE
MLLDKLLSHLAVHVEPFALCMLGLGWRLWLPGPPETMLHFVLKGDGAVRGTGDEGHRLGSLSLVIVPAGVRHALEAGDRVESELRIDAPPAGQPVHRIVAGSPENPYLVIACGVVSVRYGQALGLFDHLREMLTVDLSSAPQVGNSFQSILEEQSRPGPGGEAMTAALMTECLVHVFRRLTSRGPLPWLTALEDKRLGRAVDAILDNPGADHTVESLAGAAAMSRSAFSERFSEAFGRSPMTLLHHVRMQRAAHLLNEGALSIDEVARRVGFSSRSYFSNAFKKHHGESPVAFRNG